MERDKELMSQILAAAYQILKEREIYYKETVDHSFFLLSHNSL